MAIASTYLINMPCYPFFPVLNKKCSAGLGGESPAEFRQKFLARVMLIHLPMVYEDGILLAVNHYTETTSSSAF